MKAFNGSELFSLIHDYFKVYLPIKKHCSRHTIRAYANAMEALLDYVAEQKGIRLSCVTFDMLGHEIISSFLADMEKRGCSVATRNQRLYSIRAFYDYAANMQPTITAYKAEISKVPVQKPQKPPFVDYLREDAMKTLLEQPSLLSERGLRDRTMLVLLYDTAARVQELLDIRLCDVRFGKIPTVTLHGKGSKTRTVPIMEKTARLVQKYITVFHLHATEYSESLMFYVKHHGQYMRMCDDNVRRIVRRYAASAKELCNSIPDDVHPHMLRHSRAMHLYQNGMDLTLVSQWLGHSQIETTMIYAYADTEQKRKAIESATSRDSPLRSHDALSRYTIDDDETLKRLCGLK